MHDGSFTFNFLIDYLKGREKRKKERDERRKEVMELPSASPQPVLVRVKITNSTWVSHMGNRNENT